MKLSTFTLMWIVYLYRMLTGNLRRIIPIIWRGMSDDYISWLVLSFVFWLVVGFITSAIILVLSVIFIIPPAIGMPVIVYSIVFEIMPIELITAYWIGKKVK